MTSDLQASSPSKAYDPHTPAFYGRRQGRGLKGVKRDLFHTFLPSITVTPETLLPFLNTGTQHVLEIGFGGGEHLAAQAMAHPSTLHLGIEIFRNGIATLLETICLKSLSNIRVFPNDGRLLFDHMPKASFQDIYVLFPDPWPKKKHLERRLLNVESLTLFSSWLKPKGRLIIASDDESYKEHIMEAASSVPLKLLPDTAYERLVVTRYEDKALKAGRVPRYFVFSV